jgi:hypothetical protein
VIKVWSRKTTKSQKGKLHDQVDTGFFQKGR